MNSPQISIIIVSYGRLENLQKSLNAMRFQSGIDYELIIVADHDPEENNNKKDYLFIPFDIPNISLARNIGVAYARAKIVAFCDDDAIAEPSWAQNIYKAFTNERVIAATGRIKARNGFSDQWPLIWSDHSGLDQKTEKWPCKTEYFEGNAYSFLKLQGTNMAFRLDALKAVNGFDTRFHYFLDETDMAIRLATKERCFAAVPDAIVHHLYAENATRHKNRAPKSINKIIKSIDVFLKKHSKNDYAKFMPQHLALQKKRILRAFNLGWLAPHSANTLIKSLKKLPSNTEIQNDSDYYDKGQRAPLIRAKTHRHTLIATTRRHRKKAIERVRQECHAGHIVTFLDFNMSFWAQKRGFNKAGYWVQTGGLFGKHDRKRQIRFKTLKDAAIISANSYQKFRNVSKIIYFSPLKNVNAEIILTDTNEGIG